MRKPVLFVIAIAPAEEIENRFLYKISEQTFVRSYSFCLFSNFVDSSYYAGKQGEKSKVHVLVLHLPKRMR